MTFTFRPAKRVGVSLLIGLAGSSGSGKSFSAMRLASGISAGKRFAVIDTEAGRASHYADQFEFDVGELKAPFRPDAYEQAIMAADAAGYPVIVIDSMSHEWAGDGGILDWQDEELDRMAGDDWKKREAVRMAAWIKPKMAHKQMMQKLLQVRAHVIMCFRAEPKIEMTRVDGKLVIQPKHSMVGLNGWIPVTEKNVPFELTASFLLMADNPGVPLPIKLQEQHRAMFPPGRVIDEEAGRALAEWAAGGAKGGSKPPSDAPDWLAVQRKMLGDAKTLEQLQDAWKVAQVAARVHEDATAMSELKRVKDERKAALEVSFVTSTGVAEGSNG